MFGRRQLFAAMGLGALATTAATSPAGFTALPLRQDSVRVVDERVVDVWGQRPAQPDADAWIATGHLPQLPELPTTMFRDALADLYTLAVPYGVAVAGWSPAWRYVWPRDSAPIAIALARTGHHAEAARLLGFLQDVQPASGLFQARYLPDGSGVPDDRGVQLDGDGWALWALQQVTMALPAPERVANLSAHRLLLDRSTTAITAMVQTPTGLPPASPDYWEVPERTTTLATVAVTLAGFRSASWAYDLLGLPRPDLDQASARLVDLARTRFAPHGFPRHPGGKADSVDLGVAFLLPPMVPRADPAAYAAWQGSAHRMRRPAGGLAPGGSWRRDGVSWTVCTAWHAMVAAACGDRTTALHDLRWLDRHRTVAGSLPEKVLYDGSPASVAPLAWTAAVALLAADLLDQSPATS